MQKNRVLFVGIYMSDITRK